MKTEIVSGVSGEGPLGQIAAYGYDLVGNKTSETDVNGLTTVFEYDGLYRVDRKTFPQAKPAGGTHYEESYVYDAVGNQTRSVDANGKVTATEYDGLNRVTKVTRDVGGLDLVTTTAYDDPETTGSHVNKSEERDVAKGLRTSFVYDALNRETSRTVHLEGAGGAGAEYTTATEPTTTPTHAQRITDPRGVVSVRRLDGLDRVVEETVDTSRARGRAGPQSHDELRVRRRSGTRRTSPSADPERPDDALRVRRTRAAHQDDGREAAARASATYFGDGLKESETDRRGVKRSSSPTTTSGGSRKTRLESARLLGRSAGATRRSTCDGPQPQRIEIDARQKSTIFEPGRSGTRHQGDGRPRRSYRTFAWDGVNKVEETDKRQHRDGLRVRRGQPADEDDGPRSRASTPGRRSR